MKTQQQIKSHLEKLEYEFKVSDELFKDNHEEMSDNVFNDHVKALRVANSQIKALKWVLNES